MGALPGENYMRRPTLWNVHYSTAGVEVMRFLTFIIFPKY